MQCADNRIVRSARLSLYESVLLRSTKMANLRKKKVFRRVKENSGLGFHWSSNLADSSQNKVSRHLFRRAGRINIITKTNVLLALLKVILILTAMSVLRYTLKGLINMYARNFRNR